MSTYIMRNLISKFIDNNSIRILYAKPKEIQDQGYGKLSDNIAIYDTSIIGDLSWFSYDMLLTHQINKQILELSYAMHLPIVCHATPNIQHNYHDRIKNVFFLPEDATHTDILSCFEQLKHKRFTL